MIGIVRETSWEKILQYIENALNMGALVAISVFVSLFIALFRRK